MDQWTNEWTNEWTNGPNNTPPCRESAHGPTLGEAKFLSTSRVLRVVVVRVVVRVVNVNVGTRRGGWHQRHGGGARAHDELAARVPSLARDPSVLGHGLGEDARPAAGFEVRGKGGGKVVQVLVGFAVHEGTIRTTTMVSRRRRRSDASSS